MKTQDTPKTNLTEETVLKAAPTAQTNNEKKTKKSISPLWKSVLVGGVPGIIIGSTGTLGVEEALANPVVEPNPEAEAEPNPEDVEIQVAHNVTNDMSFSEAFATARAEVGPGGAFVWHGNVYGTYRGDDPEWQEMSAEDRAAHSQLIMSQVHRVPYTPSENEPDIVPNPNETNAEENGEDTQGQNTNAEENGEDTQGQNTNTEENGEDTQSQNTEAEENEAGDNVEGLADDTSGEVDVHIVGTGQIEMPDGSAVDVGFAQVDSHEAVFADVDGDGEVDTVLIDANDNGQLDGGEIIDVEGSGITMEMMQAEADANTADTLDDQLYSDMPDYTNDADTSSLV